MDVYNIIRQLTDQEDVNSGQIKRECFDKLLPIKDYYKGWNFHKTDVRFNFLPNEDYHKERYEVKINVDDDVERVEKIEALNEDIDEYNDWVNEKNELQGKELLEKAPPNTVGAVEDLNLENKYYSTLGKHKPWLCTFQIEHPQFRKIDNSVEFVYCDDEVIYKLMQEMEIEEFVNRFNATLYAYMIEAVGWLKKNNAFDKETEGLILPLTFLHHTTLMPIGHNSSIKKDDKVVCFVRSKKLEEFHDWLSKSPFSISS